ncbi:MAG: class I SAM-dependent methyltransferase, partial [Chthoniobacterales bacterium]
YAAIYLQHYRNSREGNSQILGLAQRMERWMHHKVAKDAASPKATLEIGAGNLNQLPYEPNSNPYDIIEPFRELFESSPHLSRVRNVYADIADIPATNRYQRITSVAVLEHVENLPELVARSALLLEDEGSFRAGIPSEGTILWRLGWQLTTALDFRTRYNLDYGVLMRYEHVNTAREIEEVLRYFFSEVRHRVFGLVSTFSFYQFFACSQPRRERCSDYLSTARPAGNGQSAL